MLCTADHWFRSGKETARNSGVVVQSVQISTSRLSVHSSDSRAAAVQQFKNYSATYKWFYGLMYSVLLFFRILTKTEYDLQILQKKIYI